MRYIYKSINDFHGAFFYRDSIFKWQKDEPLVSDSLAAEFKKGVQSVKMILDSDIGYLRVPSMGGSNYNLKAQKLNDSLCLLLDRKVKGIILDLRLNGGGAMHPMILGLKQLLGQGKVGFFKTKTIENWLIKNDDFFLDTVLYASIRPKCNIDAQNIPVVILVSPITGSSAECLIIAFKGRKNTILLGSSTAGYLTINQGFPIDVFSFMNVSVGYSGDRNGKVYKKAIKPDIPFSSVYKFNDILHDENVMEAAEWLKLHIK